MKTHYWLPELERGCNCINLRRVEWSGAWGIEFQPGTAAAAMDGEPDPATFKPDPDIPPRGRVVRDEADFSAFLDEQLVPFEPTKMMDFVRGLMKYLWLQHKGLRPVAPVADAGLL